MTAADAIMHTYGRLPVAFVRGDGCYLIDTDGKRYLDAVAGVAVNSLGHSHAGFIAAIREQVGTLVHTSNLYEIPLQAELAQTLCEKSGMQQAFFCNSGAESIEAAIKIARRFGHNMGVAVPGILVMEGAFHGRTMGALTATHSEKYQEGFTPLLEGFYRVPYNDVAAVEAAIVANPNIVAILVEPAQGETGVRIPAANYLNELRRVCDTNNMLLMLDEVQTGNGRTGTWFACQHNKVLPDVLSTAKGLGNGYPIGACLVAGKAKNIFAPGNHGSTFGGSPLSCTCASPSNGCNCWSLQSTPADLPCSPAAIGICIVRNGGATVRVASCEEVQTAPLPASLTASTAIFQGRTAASPLAFTG